MTDSPIRKRLAMAGAVLFFVGMLTGLWAAATLTGTVVVGIPRLALVASQRAPGRTLAAGSGLVLRVPSLQ